MATLKCTKCGRILVECQGCKGGRQSTGTCSQCKNTGQVCPEHGPHWK